jgi:amino-acid N-acetyltransferase
MFRRLANIQGLDVWPPLVLVPASTEDASAVRALLEEASLPVDGLEDQFPDAYVIARAGSVPVGAAGLETYGKAGLLRSVVVATGARGKGCGRQLVESRLAYARARGIERVFLLTTTASQYFERLGFTIANRSEAPAALARSPEFASVCPASATCLVRAP